MGDDEDEAIQASAKAQIAKSVAYAEESPLPSARTTSSPTCSTRSGG